MKAFFLVFLLLPVAALADTATCHDMATQTRALMADAVRQTDALQQHASVTANDILAESNGSAAYHPVYLAHHDATRHLPRILQLHVRQGRKLDNAHLCADPVADSAWLRKRLNATEAYLASVTHFRRRLDDAVHGFAP